MTQTITSPYPWSESDRLAALQRYAILDTPPEQAFDDVVKLVADLLDAPIAAINLIAQGRQWFKSEIGLGVRQMPLDDSICSFAILERGGLVVPDTTKDHRFKCNPLVTGTPGLRFYAGELLETPDGYPLGTLCVLDVEPRPNGLTSQQRFILKTLAQQVMSQLELRRVLKEQQDSLIAQQRIEEELRAERDRSLHLLEGMDEAFIFLDTDFRVQQINAGAMRMEVRPRSEMLGRTHWEVWPGSAELEPLSSAYRRAMRERVPVNFEQLYVFPDGRSYWVDIRAYPVEGGLAVFYRNINEKKHAETALRESEAKFRTIADAMPQMVWSTTPDGMHDYYNRQWYQYAGVPVGSTDGEGWNAMFHPEDQARAWKAWRHSLATGETYEIHYRLRHHTGAYRWVLGRALPVRDDAGKIIRWMGTCTDIHDQKLTEEALKEASSRKDEFLAMLAHELRNPLAPISTAAHILKLAGTDEKRVKQSSEIIVRQVKHMTNLVDDLLDVSRVTRGLVQLEKENVDIKSIVSGAIEQARPLIESRNHALTTRIGAVNAFVHADRTRLVQVIANLLNNAAKYTPQDGEIRLIVKMEEERVKISVTDNGIGIDPKLLPHVFELFTQAERTPDRAQGGLGLGLALAKSITALHGGHVEARSDGPGKGSTFTIEIPLCKTEADHAQAPQEHVQPDHTKRQLRLMIVDDNVDAAESLAALMEAEGHEVKVLAEANSALQAALIYRPDVFILDIGLPGMNGYELTRELRTRDQTANALFVALTGYGQAHDKVLSRAAGFDHHFVKPVDIEQLDKILLQTSSGRGIASNTERAAITSS